jgi:2-haloacid dehalogenase
MRNIIFDFGNVLVRWEPEKIYAEHFGDEAKAWWFLRHVADNDWRLRIDAGESQDACIAEQQARYPEYSQALTLYRDRWRDMLTGEMPGMRDIIVELRKKGHEIYGLTNWSMETFPEAREHFTILQLIDRYVVSGQERLVKPDERLFRVLLDRYGLKAEECTFVDDNPDNVAAACRMGMEGIVFTGADDLRIKLNIRQQ